MKRQTNTVSVILLLLAGACVVYAVNPLALAEMRGPFGGRAAPEEPPPATGEGKITMAEGVSLASVHQQLIRDYMDAYFLSLSRLELNYPEELLAPGAPTMVGDKAVWEIAVAVRKMQAVDLRLDWYSYELFCSEVETEDNGDVAVRLTENNVLSFRQYPDVDSESRNIRHRFTLSQVDGEWCIQHHRGGGTVSNLVMRRFRDATDVDMLDVMASVPETREMVMEDARTNMERRPAPGETTPVAAPAVDHTYDREAAVAYAAEWSLKRNLEWPIYDEYGGNCANLTSQCLFAGGIPMDYRGRQQWKWYGETTNSLQRPTGRSAAWASVDSFYEYVTTNTGFGMVTTVEEDYYAGEPGDILQMGWLEDWRHSVLITKVIKDEEGRTVDYLISSNTADQRDFPASAYLYTMQRLVKVWGWRE